MDGWPNRRKKAVFPNCHSVHRASENARDLVLFSDWIITIGNLSCNATKNC